jgi:hypothetical protein
MSSLRPWSEEGASDEELRLIASSNCERPDGAARMRTLMALGVGSSPSGWPPSAARSMGRRAGPLTKLVVVAAIGGGAIAGFWWFRSAPRVVASAIRTEVSAPAISVPPPSGPVVVPVETRAAPDTPVGPTPTLQRRRPRPISAAPAPDFATGQADGESRSSTLAAEVAALERAQAALAGDDAELALRALDRYQARFPRGRLSSEETVLRVRALLAAGDRDRAGALAESFSAAHPGSSYARRMGDLVRAAPGKSKNW